jgi:hypothetical protein
MDVKLPNGQVIKGIPEGTPKDVIMQKAISGGFATQADFGETVIDEVSVPQPIEQPQQGSSFIDEVIGGAEGAATMLSGAVAAPIAGIAGLADTLNPFAPEGAGAERVKQIQEDLTYQPRTKEGGQALEPVQAIGEKIGEFNEFIGDDTFEATGSPFLASIATALPEATLSLLGVKKGSSVQQASQNKATQAISKGVDKTQSATKQKIGELIQSGSESADTAPYKIIQNLEKGTSKVVQDPIAKAAIGQGFDPGVVAVIKGGSNADKAKMNSMVNILEKSQSSSRFAMKNRPADIAGDSLMDRFKAVRDESLQAGRSLDVEAKKLKGVKLDKAPIIKNFAESLDSMGVRFDKAGNPIFKGSDIEGLGASMKAIKQITNRLKSVKTSDAFELHRLKRFIDENVTYGKSGEGLKGAAERSLKGLRSSVDELLDQNFPAYDKINQKYSDTITSLNAFQDVAGKKMNLSGVNADKATGTLMRRLMSNAQSRVPLLDAIDSLESTAIKYGAKFDDDLLSQVLLVDELDKVFGPAAKTSLLGDVTKGASGSFSTTQAVLGAGKEAAKNIMGPSQAKALKAIKDLLGDVNDIKSIQGKLEKPLIKL